QEPPVRRIRTVRMEVHPRVPLLLALLPPPRKRAPPLDLRDDPRIVAIEPDHHLPPARLNPRSRGLLGTVDHDRPQSGRTLLDPKPKGQVTARGREGRPPEAGEGGGIVLGAGGKDEEGQEAESRRAELSRVHCGESIRSGT